MRDCVRLMRETFEALRSGAAQNQPRRRMHLPTGTVLHSLAGAWGKYLGTKVYATNPKHGAYFFFLLFDAETARPAAMPPTFWRPGTRRRWRLSEPASRRAPSSRRCAKSASFAIYARGRA